MIVSNLSEIKCCDQKKRRQKSHSVLVPLFCFFFCCCHAEGDAATKGQLKEWKTTPSSQQDGTKWLLAATLCKGRQKSLTVEQRRGLQRHALACKHKSPSLSLDLWFPPSVVRSATEPFLANFPNEINPFFQFFMHFLYFTSANAVLSAQCHQGFVSYSVFSQVNKGKYQSICVYGVFALTQKTC